MHCPSPRPTATRLRSARVPYGTAPRTCSRAPSDGSPARASRPCYTVMAVTDSAAGPRGISAFVVESGDEGLSFGPPENKLGLRGSPIREVYLNHVRIGADRMIGPPGSGLGTALASLEHSRITIA